MSSAKWGQLCLELKVLIAAVVWRDKRQGYWLRFRHGAIRQIDQKSISRMKCKVVFFLGPLLLTWIKFNTSMDK